MSLLDTASLIVTPNGYKEGKLYSVIPSDGSGDMSVTRATTATRVNSACLVESVANNIPRLDYSNGTCPSLLVEPQRTNLLTYSSSFDNGAWTTSNATITANAITSPSGIQDAELLTSTSTTETGVFRLISVTGTNTWSVYAKKGTGKYLLINTNTPVISAKFDLESGQVVGTPSGGATATIQDAGNGWYRCIVTSTTSTNRFTIFITNNTTADNLTSSVGLSCYIWGAQLEAGSYATSYIPTTSASVTRNADVISKTGISSLIGQTEGTLFVDEIYDSNAKNNGGLDDTLISLTDGTSNNLISIFHYGGGVGTILLFIRLSNTTQVAISTSASTSGAYKIALAYKNNDVVGYVNGVQIGTDTSATIPATSAVVFYDPVTTNAATKTVNIKAAAIWKTRLTNAQLAQLTTI